MKLFWEKLTQSKKLSPGWRLSSIGLPSWPAALNLSKLTLDLDRGSATVFDPQAGADWLARRGVQLDWQG